MADQRSTQDLIGDTYSAVNREFREWKLDYTKTILISFAPVPIPLFNGHKGEDVVVAHVPPNFTLSDSDSEEGKDTFIHYYINESNSEPVILQKDSVDSVEPEWPENYDPNTIQNMKPLVYECTTPFDRSHSIGDDPDDLQFLPFSDDPTFVYGDGDKAKEYIKLHNRVDWFHKKDPDEGIIIAETLRRLVDEHNIPASTFSPGENGGGVDIRGYFRDEITERIRKRDLPPEWSRSQALRAFTERDHKEQLDSSLSKISNIVDTHISLFCPHPNCMGVFCQRHLTSTPKPPPPAPKLTHDQVLRQLRPCGASCWMHVPHLTYRIDPQWNDDTIDQVKELLLYSPDDLPPCHLAERIRKKCDETYYYWIIHRPHIVPVPNIRHRRATFRDRQDLDAKQEHIACSHSGPCNSQARGQCVCFDNSIRCEASCVCDLSCKRRSRGCNCSHSEDSTCSVTAALSPIKRDILCPCVASGRECDPHVCKSCVSPQKCRNMQIFHNKMKTTAVKRGKWGLGLFLEDTANGGDLLLEYVGELIYEDTFASREFLSKHRNRNYVFGLTNDLSVDSTLAGNGSKFINHSKDPKEVNCQAKVLNVRGELRIAIFATRTIPNEEELFFDYGPAFFNDVNGSSSTPIPSRSPTEPSNSAGARSSTSEDSDYQPSKQVVIQSKRKLRTRTRSFKAVLSDDVVRDDDSTEGSSP